MPLRIGAVAVDVKKAIDETAKEVPKGSTVVLLGQVQTMNSAFSGLLFGLLAAIVLIYLLIVVNFQSWSDPFVIVSGLENVSEPEEDERENIRMNHFPPNVRMACVTS